MLLKSQMRTSAGFLLGTLGRLGLVSWCSRTLRPQPKITSFRRSICRCTGTAGVNGPSLLCIGVRLYCQRDMVYSAKPSRSDKDNAIQISYVLGLGIPKHIGKVALSDELPIRQYWACHLMNAFSSVGCSAKTHTQDSHQWSFPATKKTSSWKPSP